jgi:hypothetical protein
MPIQSALSGVADHFLTTPKTKLFSFVIRQKAPKHFTFFMGPADNLLIDSIKKSDWSSFFASLGLIVDLSGARTIIDYAMD